MRISVLLLLITLLPGCSTTSVRLTETERQAAWQNHLKALGASHRWNLRGRIALHANDRGWQASLRWVQSEREQLIQLTGPFGSGMVSLKHDQNGAVLTDSRGNQYTDSDTERLLQRVMGWHFPVIGLRYWVRGQAIPGTAAELELDELGRLKRLKQKNWDIRYLAYTRYGSLHLPRRIFMSRPLDDGSGQMLDVRLVLSRWQLDP